MFKLEFRTDNAAFENRADEIARILRELIRVIDLGVTGGGIRDNNRNTVGSWILKS